MSDPTHLANSGISSRINWQRNQASNWNFYNMPKSRLLPLSWPVREGELSISHAQIPDWLHPFTGGWELLTSSQCGPHQVEWTLSFSNVFISQSQCYTQLHIYAITNSRPPLSLVFLWQQRPNMQQLQCKDKAIQTRSTWTVNHLSRLQAKE